VGKPEGRRANECGQAVGNLSGQFWADIDLNALDQFVKHALRWRYYVRGARLMLGERTINSAHSVRPRNPSCRQKATGRPAFSWLLGASAGYVSPPNILVPRQSESIVCGGSVLETVVSRP
jgi:hypothetical protein